MTDSKISGNVHVGCQGWNYDDWVSKAGSEGGFYPHATRTADMLEVYASAFETVEVDSTFYAIPSAQVVESWASRTPEGFTFSLKLPQEITHQRALRGGGSLLLEEFCERARHLKERLGVVLIQMPPQFELTTENAQALRDFIPRLPRDLRFAIEFRHADWMKQRVADLLAKHNVALALVEGRWIERAEMRRFAEKRTATFSYIRWMGERDLVRFDTVQRKEDRNLKEWAEVIAALRERSHEIFAYFSNFYEGHAPASANSLKRMLGQTVVEAADLEDQPSLF